VQISSEASVSPCGTIPSIAQAYSFNITVSPHNGSVGYLTVWPAGSSFPNASTLNDPQGVLLANAAIIPAGTPNGGVSVFNAGPAATDVIIDMNGFFAAPSDLNGNTAVGAGTLTSNTLGAQNTATGADALQANTIGSDNTANGAQALQSNTQGNYNTASGVSASQSNTTGGFNSAIGYQAMQNNTIGNSNTAVGYTAMQSNISGGQNTATGDGALGGNTTGSTNTANGSGALGQNDAGTGNTASGEGALSHNSSGNYNTAVGFDALQSNTTGGSNIGIGLDAGDSAPVGNNNSIYIGSTGSGVDNSGTIQIGSIENNTGGTFIAGISGATSSSGVEVFINTNGQLGTLTSSGRFKEEIADMGDTSSKLLRLRPVTFYYKPEYDDGSHLPQYGLIAEEVAKVFPEMVAYGKDGKPWTVRYQLLAPMLLNEVQKQAEQIRGQAAQDRELNERQSDRIMEQAAEIQSLERRLAAVEALLPAPSAVR
jgi:Chaperone of endosialidase